ncbi:MAG: hypothetical protein HS115_03150 [Spirochaetales bacterium]|nr:hypothetical protein [Spirochaetales bacterium]
MYFFVLPAGSDDFYRFLWDGRLLLLGENPFLELPVTLRAVDHLKTDDFLASLYPGLNSTHYFSVYPPLMQGFFLLAALAGSVNGGVLILRSLVLVFDLFLFFWCRRRGKWSVLAAFWLCPLWIYEGVGNLHLEVFAATFLLLALHSPREGSRIAALAAAVQSKLWPILLLPLFLFRRPRWKLWILAFVLQIPLVFWMGGGGWPYPFLAGLSLYSEHFLFNPGPLQILRSLFDLPRAVLAGVAGILVLSFTFFTALWGKAPPDRKAGNIYFFYIFLSFCIHPWYILPLIVLQPLRPAVLAWTYLIFLSYSGYRTVPATVPDVILFMEFGLLTIFLFLERLGGRTRIR